MHTYEVLRRPVLTEKSTALGETGKYVFEVARGSTKPQIAKAVEKAFKVKVTGVNVMTVAGKSRRMGRRIVQRPKWRKAVVTLKAGDKIAFFEGV
ncbi:MAG: 50S ribosomal protein L23 [Chloroflexota bacterium]